MLSFFSKAIELSVKNEDEDSVLKGFVELAETAPKVFKAHLQDVINLMLMVSGRFWNYDDNEFMFLGLALLFLSVQR